ncbi:MAG: glucosamine-6-phosphate deaminase [Anaerolineales bacterium]
MIELQIYPDDISLNQAAAEWMAGIIRAQPDSKLVLALGKSPEGTYQTLAHMVKGGVLSFRKCRVYQLDEYLGLKPGDRRLLFAWLLRSCLDPLDIPANNVVRLPSESPNLEKVCAKTDRIVNQFGIDAMVLGLGPNGHLGFNEPGSRFDSPTRVVTLTPESLVSNATYWGKQEDVPTRALTMGLGTLSHARRSLLVVNGSHKRDILQRMLLDEISPKVPATCMRNWSNVTVMADAAAAIDLEPGPFI